MTLFRLTTIFTFFICVLTVSACKQNKPFEELTDEEKVDYEVYVGGFLTDEEKSEQKAVRQKLLRDSAESKRATAELDEAMGEAQAVLPEEMMAALKEAQSKWVVSGRGVEINQLVSEGRSIQEANVEVVRQRAEKVRELTTRAILIDSPGQFQGYYRAEAGRSLEVFEIDGVAHVTLRIEAPRLVVTARGKIKPESPESVIVSNDAEPDVSFEMKRVEDGVVDVVVTDRFRFSTMKQFAGLPGGRYMRVKEGELDVFSF